jgi:hypothetical protein
MPTGSTKLQLPIAKAVGSQFQAVSANPTVARPQVAVPPPAPLVINGKSVVIDVRTMSGADVVAVLNTIPGVTASIDGQGRLVIQGANNIMGDGALREILGI